MELLLYTFESFNSPVSYLRKAYSTNLMGFHKSIHIYFLTVQASPFITMVPNTQNFV